jgi:hypothetical protein
MRGLKDYLSFKQCLGNGAKINATANGSAVTADDLNGSDNSLCFVVLVGAITDGSHVLSLQDSIDNGNSWQAVAAPYVAIPSGQSNTVTSSTPAGTVLKFDYLSNPNLASITASAGYPVSNPAGIKVQVRLIDTVSGATQGGYLTGFAAFGLAANEPAA